LHGQSLLADFPQMDMALSDVGRGEIHRIAIRQFHRRRKTPPLPELLENIHAGLSRSFDAVTRELDHVQIALSGDTTADIWRRSLHGASI